MFFSQLRSAVREIYSYKLHYDVVFFGNDNRTKGSTHFLIFC